MARKAEKKNTKTKRELPYNSRKPIRHAYDKALTATARLLTFSLSGGFSDGPVDERQGELAVDDLIALAIHGRRLIENTKAFDLISGAVITCGLASGPKQVPVLRILNIVIHHLRIELIRRQSDIEPDLDFHTAEGLARFMKVRKERVVPSVMVKSDRGDSMFFRLTDLVKAFETQVLNPIVDYCDDRGLYLENLDTD